MMARTVVERGARQEREPAPESVTERAERYWTEGVYPHGPEHDCFTCAIGRQARRLPPLDRRLTP